MSFTVNPTTVAPSASLTASGTGAKKRGTRIRVSPTDPVMGNAILAEFTMPASGKFSRTISAPGGSDRSVTLMLQQKRADGVWAQTASVSVVILATVGGGGGTTPVPNPPPSPPPDITAPTISGVSHSVTTTTATVLATTNEAATVVVEYGTTTQYGAQTAATSSGTSHSRTITGLVAGQTYQYRVRATDTALNVRVDTNRSFTTTASPTPPAPPPPTPVSLRFGTLDATTAQVANYLVNGLTIAGLQTGWDRHEKPTTGLWSTSDLNAYAADFAGFKNASLKVSLEMGLNYPPSFYQNATYKFIDQFGTAASGRVLDWIWRAAARDKVEAYVRKLHVYVPFTDTTISDVRISTDEISELLFPQHTQGGTVNSYWAYSTPAQGGAGLATGTVGGVARNATAVPSGWAGWKPGDALPGGKPNVSEWYGWYLDSLVEATTWMTALLRSLGFTGRVWAVIPGQGAKPTQQAAAYAALLGSGSSPATMAVGAAFHLVYPRLAASGSGIGGWCSSAAENVGMTDITQPGDATLVSEDEAWSSHRRHAWLAARNGMARAVENPGGGTSGYGLTMLDYLVRQARACGATVCSWAHETNLVNGTGGSNGGAVSFAGYKSKINPGAPVPTNIVVSDVTTTSARISWSQTVPGTGQVRYGTSTGYGQTTTLESSFLTAHSQPISGLLPGVIYHFAVVTADAAGNVGLSSDRIFTTTALNPPPIPPASAIYGPGISGDGLGNTRFQGGIRVQSCRFRATYSSALTAFTFYYLGPPDAGYALGTGGTWKAEVFADDASANHYPTGSPLCTQNVAALGGSDADRVITFASPATLSAGVLYHLVFTLTDASPDANHFSTDHWFIRQLPTGAPGGRVQPRFPNTDWAHMYYEHPSGPWVVRSQYTPILDLAYANGSHQGQSYGEAQYGPNDVGEITGTSKMVRERFTVSGGNRQVSGAGIRLLRQSGTDPLTVRLEDDAGTLIDSFTIAANFIPIGPAPTGANNSDNDLGVNAKWQAGVFAAVRTLVNGTAYRLRLSTAAGSIYWAWTNRRLSESYPNYTAATAFQDGYAEVTTNGSTWSALGVDVNQYDLQFYLVVA